MRTIKRLLVWLWLMTKRIYKKPVLLLSLALVVVLVAFYGMTADEDSGMLTVALAREDDDPVAISMIADLADGGSLIRFIECASPEEAESLVRDEKADAAWIMRDDTEARIYKFVARPSQWNSFIRIVEREKTVPLMLAREKLGGVVFKYCSPVMYLTYLRENVPQVSRLSDEELMKFYDEKSIDFNLFEFDYIGGGGEGAIERADYLTTPLRGLLAVVVTMCSLASGLYYIRDEENGMYTLIPEGKRPIAELGTQLITSLNVSAVAAVSLGVAGLSVEPWREVVMLVLFSLAASFFGMAVRRLAGGMRPLATLLPLIVVVMLVVCPVFFDLGALRELQYLFPPTYYVNGAYSDRFLWLTFAYIATLGAVYFALGEIRRIRR